MAINAERIHKPVRKLRKFLKKSPKRPTSDQIHGVRTSARRFETVVNALDARPLKHQRRLLGDVAQVRKRTGKIRDMDVLTGRALRAELTQKQDGLVRLLEILGERRAKHVKRLRSVIASTGPALRRRLKRAESKLEKLIEKDSQSGSAPDAAHAAMAKALRMSEELKSPPRLDKKNLHPYRLKVKELRYILQLADRADQQEFVSKLGEVKDAIGEWHDWEELVAIADDVLDQPAERKLLPKLRGISEKKYAHALSLTNHLRRSFLNISDKPRSQTRSRYVATIRPPVFAATSAISA